jgi:hypothetical protein
LGSRFEFGVHAAIGSSNWAAVLEGNGEPQRSDAPRSRRRFDTMGVHPFIGRSFEKRATTLNVRPS